MLLGTATRVETLEKPMCIAKKPQFVFTKSPKTLFSCHKMNKVKKDFNHRQYSTIHQSNQVDVSLLLPIKQYLYMYG